MILCYVLYILFGRKVYALDVVGAIPDELWNLTYLINLYVFYLNTDDSRHFFGLLHSY